MNFRELLKSRKWSSNRLAEALGVNTSTVRRWYMHECTPNPSTILRIAELIGVSVEIVVKSFDNYKERI